jgi:hypothetical protein
MRNKTANALGLQQAVPSAAGTAAFQVTIAFNKSDGDAAMPSEITARAR